MALRQGRCKNCGSIIMVDTAKDDAVCMFCWAHTNPSEAVAIDADPEAYEFPNETMGEPSAEEQAQAFGTIASNAPVVKKSQPSIKKNKEKKMTPAEKVALAKKELVEPVVPKKSKLIIAGISLGIVLLAAAIILPLTLNRNNKRALLAAKMPNFISGVTLKENEYAFEGQNNDRLTLVLQSEVTDEQVAEIIRNFRTLWAETYEVSVDEAQDNMRIKIYSKSGLTEVTGSGKILNQ